MSVYLQTKIFIEIFKSILHYSGGPILHNAKFNVFELVDCRYSMIVLILNFNLIKARNEEYTAKPDRYVFSML